MTRAAVKAVKYEALVNGHWHECQIIEQLGVRFRVRIRGLTDKNAVHVDGRGITIIRKPWQIRTAHQK